MAVVLKDPQEKVNNKTIKLMESIISDIEKGNVDVKNSMYDYATNKEESFVEIVLDKSIKYELEE